MIPPLKKAMDLKQIFEKIQEVMDQKKLHILSESFSDFFHESLFYLHTDAGLKKEQIIRILHDKLYAQGYTSPSFYEDVIKRRRPLPQPLDASRSSFHENGRQKDRHSSRPVEAGYHLGQADCSCCPVDRHTRTGVTFIQKAV